MAAMSNQSKKSHSQIYKIGFFEESIHEFKFH